MDKNTPKYLIVHHTGGTEKNPLADTSHHTFEIVNNEHRNNPKVWLGYFSKLGYAIGYHYFIDKTGKVTQGRKDDEAGAHCVSHNKDSIGICLAGNFDLTFPTQEQENALRELLNQKRKEYLIPRENIIPHRHFSKKTCYGDKLSKTWASDLTIEKSVELKPNINMCTSEEKEIEELKKQIAWYDKLIAWFFANSKRDENHNIT